MAQDMTPYWEIDCNDVGIWGLIHVTAAGRLREIVAGFGKYEDAEAKAKALQPEMEIRLTKAAQRARNT